MKASQKILLIALSISLHSAIMSMEGKFNFADAIQSIQNAKKQQKDMRRLLKVQTTHITEFAQKSEHNPEHMEILGKWLTEQRTNISDDKTWKTLITMLTNDTNASLYRCLCLENDITEATIKTVEKIAEDLKPGQDCSELLVQQTQKTITEVQKTSKNKSIH